MLTLLDGAPHQLPHINCKLLEYLDDTSSNKPSSRKVCFSFAAYAKNVINHMRNVCHIPMEDGLTEEEFSEIEATFGFIFPPDLRSILQEGLPVGQGFPHWRSSSSSFGLQHYSYIKSLLDLPIKALCAEVDLSNFWPSQWGARPTDNGDAIQAAAYKLAQVPTLVPIYANCYIPCFPVQAGNPVFLVQEGVILYCGYDLADFFKRQAFVPRAASHIIEQHSYASLHEAELHHGSMSTVKAQMNMQRTAPLNELSQCEGADNGREFNVKEHIVKDMSLLPMWRWADESPRITATSMHQYMGYLDESLSSCSSSSLSSKSIYDEDQDHVQLKLSSPSSSSSASSLLWLDSHGHENNNRLRSNPSSSPLTEQDLHHAESNAFSAPLSPSALSTQGRASSGQNHYPLTPKLSATSSTSGAGKPDHSRGALICKKYLYLHEMPLPSRVLTNFTMAAPPWAAKEARKIVFWGDVAEGYISIETKMSSSNTASRASHLTSSTGQPAAAYDWLSAYLDGLADALRQGRWDEADICDMLMVMQQQETNDSQHEEPLASSISCSTFYGSLDVSKLQSCLQQAGWSAQDTLHMLPA